VQQHVINNDDESRWVPTLLYSMPDRPNLYLRPYTSGVGIWRLKRWAVVKWDDCKLDRRPRQSMILLSYNADPFEGRRYTRKINKQIPGRSRTNIPAAITSVLGSGASSVGTIRILQNGPIANVEKCVILAAEEQPHSWVVQSGSRNAIWHEFEWSAPSTSINNKSAVVLANDNLLLFGAFLIFYSNIIVIIIIYILYCTCVTLRHDKRFKSTVVSLGSAEFRTKVTKIPI